MSIVLHPGLDRLALGVAGHGLEGLRAEARIAFDDRVDLAVDDRLHGFLAAVDRQHDHVLARHLARGFERRDGAHRHLVIVRIDHVGVRMRLQQRFGHLAALVAGEVAGLRCEDGEAAGGVDRLVKALLAVVGGRRAGGAFELDDLGLAVGVLDQPFGHALAFLDEVRADEGDIVLAGLGERLVDVAVEQDDRDAGLLGGHDGRDQRLFLARGEEDQVDALGDHRVDVGDLLGGRAGGVGVDELVAELGGLVLHAVGLRDAPGIVGFGLGEADLVGVLLREFRQARRKRRPAVRATAPNALAESRRVRRVIDSHRRFLSPWRSGFWRPDRSNEFASHSEILR